jgi:hypothetical protein
LNAGKNTLAIMKSWGHVDIDKISVSVPQDNPVSSSSSSSVVSSSSFSAPTLADASYSVEENSAAGLVLGTLVATDPDESAPNNTLTYKVLSGNNAGMFTLSDAGKLSVAKDGLDYETVTSYTLTVQVSDAGTPSLKDTAIVKISVLNVNEKPVVIESSSSISLPSSSSSLQVESSSSEEIILPSSSSTVVESSSSEETIQPSSSSIDESSSSAVLWIEYRNSLNLFKVMVQEKNLLIDNLSQIETYNVLDLQGRLICSGRLNQGMNSIYLQNSGIYLVKIGNSIQKIKIH